MPSRFAVQRAFFKPLVVRSTRAGLPDRGEDPTAAETVHPIQWVGQPRCGWRESRLRLGSELLERGWATPGFGHPPVLPEARIEVRRGAFADLELKHALGD